MRASGTASTITASGSRSWTRHQVGRIVEADHQCLVVQNEGKPGSRSRRVPPREELHGNCNHLPVLPTDHDHGRRLSPLWSSCRSRQYVSRLPRSRRRLSAPHGQNWNTPTTSQVSNSVPTTIWFPSSPRSLMLARSLPHGSSFSNRTPMSSRNLSDPSCTS